LGFKDAHCDIFPTHTQFPQTKETHVVEEKGNTGKGKKKKPKSKATT
jgi:hypothetical protein